MGSNDALPLPSFEKAGKFAVLVGIRTKEAWARYIAGKTREDVFQQVLSVINSRVVQTPLESN
jgi:predicted phosphoadenosine phosphosulfate sulfurtransferase